MAGLQKLLVVAIDFGTTYSGYAFSFNHEYKQDKNKVHTYLWKTGIGIETSTKTPTSVLFDSFQRFHSFGYEAENDYCTLTDDQQKQWFFFKKFKMTLFKNENLSRFSTIKDVTGKEMNAMTVFSASIKYLRDHFYEFLSETLPVVSSDIQWVLTVPAIWNDAAKQFMRNAAEKAGISGDSLTLALEPEAAALYCSSSIHQERFTAGYKFMVVDSGGGTVDITVHKVQSSGKLQEVCPPTGGPWGGIKVDDAFQSFLMKVFGVSAIRQMSKNDNLQIEREFEIIKRSLVPKSPFSSFYNIRIPYCLRVHLDPTKAMQHSVRIIGDKLQIPSQTMKNFFENPVQNIIAHVRQLMYQPGVMSTEAIYLVGGFSDSEPLQTAIKTSFQNKRVYSPLEANSVVLKGAVMFGHNTDAITCRVAKHTYGIEMVQSFVHGVHPQSKLRVIEGKEYCEDIFTTFVRIGDLVENGFATPFQTFCPVRSGQLGMSIEVLMATTKSPSYTTETGCKTLGRIIVNMPDISGDKNRQVKVRMVFQGTEIKVEAIDGNTGHSFSAKFDFLN